MPSNQFSSVSQSCPTLCDPTNCSTPGLPAQHQPLETTKTHVHRVGDAIKSSHPLSSPPPTALNPSEHYDLFQRGNSSQKVAKLLEFPFQHQSFQWKLRADRLQDGLVGSSFCPKVFSNNTVHKHKFSHSQLSSQSNSHIHTWLLIKPSNQPKLKCNMIRERRKSIPPSIFPRIRVFSSESAFPIRWPKYWSFSFSIGPSSEYSGLISVRIDWFELLDSRGLSRVFSSTTFQKHQFFGTQPSFWSSSYICTWPLDKP